jgi:hypothetical protein
MGTRVVTVNDVLDGHVALDIECLDRIYLNGYVPILQSSGQVVAFLCQHLGYPFPSPALFDKIGQRFRTAVTSFAQANNIPWVKFGMDDRKLEMMRPHLDRQAATGRSGGAAIGVAQEFQRVWTAYERPTRTGARQFSFTKADRRVSCYYFYLWDDDFGPAFVKVCAYFPYPIKIWDPGPGGPAAGKRCRRRPSAPRCHSSRSAPDTPMPGDWRVRGACAGSSHRAHLHLL